MGVFDYKKYGAKESAELMTVSHKLAVYSTFASYFYLPAAKMLNGLGNISGNWFPNKIEIAPPPKWRELMPSELGLPNSSKDISGYYTIASTVTGNRPISGMGPQSKIFAEFNEQGKPIKIALGWAGTNDLLDVADYFHLNSGKIAPNMEPLLNAIKQYGIQNGLSGEDVLITGYSSGGAFTNIMAKYSDSLAGGFFKNSDYIGHASPFIYDNPDVIFNMGFENDAVFRILGDSPTFSQALKELKPWLVNPDKHFNSTSDNIILFNYSYASLFWHPKALSVLNIPQGWGAHFSGVITDATKRISESKFYEYTQKHSKIIVDALPALPRLFVWVRDKTKVGHKGYGDPAFIIGNEHNNLLQGNKGGDYIDAKGGNDKIKVGAGADVVDGGAGIDTLILSGRSNQWEVYRLEDKTLYFNSKYLGLKEASNIEKVTFDRDPRSNAKPYDITEWGLFDHRYLIKHKNKDIHYKSHIEGTDKSDELSGAVVFGKDGNDMLTAIEPGSLLHGGKGNDILIGKNGDDYLYGAEGNDILYGGAGNNVLYGGIGHDIFSFDEKSTGRTVIKDFNKYAGDMDSLLFSKSLFESSNSVYQAARKIGKDVHISKDNVNVILEDISLYDLHGNVGII
ncbi:hypothetical protein RO21_06835 [[Actinobacillus] muris]|uniref:Calcium-binding protein n=1 Tax=Muribacter muris TaxID=67855 RepID=A0A0J5P787_9PAST|nr:calcium-binding protein [Muribacter muris]KMK51329.1 hypothetical protein RO21_06835 [[Actinobacillus] muris] [Muribacter muris]